MVKSSPEEPHLDQTAHLEAVTITDPFRHNRKSLHSTSERGMGNPLSCQSLTPVLRAAITEEVRDSIQQESCLPFPWGHTQEAEQKIAHSTWP